MGTRAKEISSATNETFKQLRSLTASRGIQKENLAIVSGSKFIAEIVRDFPQSCEAWISKDHSQRPPLDCRWYLLSKQLFDELDIAGTDQPLLLIKVPEIQEWNPKGFWQRGCHLFLGLQNPENLGAMIRTAAAFGVSRIVLLKESAHPFHPKALRSSGTASLRVPLQKGPSIADLALEEIPLIALDAGGESLPQFRFPDTFAMVPGVEGPGLPSSLKAKKTLSIPMQQGVESLNAATATAIALYQWHCQCLSK